MPDTKPLFDVPIIIPVTQVERDAIRSGKAQWLVQKSVPSTLRLHRIRVLCCLENGVIDTEFIMDRCDTIDPNEAKTLERYAQDTGLTVDEILEYFHTGRKSKCLRMWHVSEGKPLMALGKPKTATLSDFDIKAPLKKWEYSRFFIREKADGQMYRVTCRESVYGRVKTRVSWEIVEGEEVFPAVEMDPDAEYCEWEARFQEYIAPAGHIVLKRRDGFPYRGHICWLVRLEDVRPTTA